MEILKHKSLFGSILLHAALFGGVAGVSFVSVTPEPPSIVIATRADAFTRVLDPVERDETSEERPREELPAAVEPEPWEPQPPLEELPQVETFEETFELVDPISRSPQRRVLELAREVTVRPPAPQPAPQSPVTRAPVTRAPVTQAPQVEEPSAAVDDILDGIPLASHAPSPTYPLRAWRQEQDGTVVLLAQVSETGKVLFVEVERSSGHALLDESAEKTLLEWVFLPRLSKGVAQPFRVRVPFVFSLTAQSR